MLAFALLILVAYSNVSFKTAEAQTNSNSSGNSTPPTVKNNGNYSTHYLCLAVTVDTFILDQHTETYSIDDGQPVTIPTQNVVMIDKGAWFVPPIYQYTTTLPYLEDGAHTITIHGSEPYIAQIRAGEYWTYQYTINFTIDTTHIAITDLSIKNQTYTSANNITLDCATNKTAAWMGYSLDGNETVAFLGNTTLPTLESGSHALTVYANDSVGNSCSEVVYFTVEPLTQLLVPAGVILAVAAIAVSVAVLALKLRKKRMNG